MPLLHHGTKPSKPESSILLPYFWEPCHLPNLVAVAVGGKMSQPELRDYSASHVRSTNHPIRPALVPSLPHRTFAPCRGFVCLAISHGLRHGLFSSALTSLNSERSRIPTPMCCPPAPKPARAPRSRPYSCGRLHRARTRSAPSPHTLVGHRRHQSPATKPAIGSSFRVLLRPPRRS